MGSLKLLLKVGGGHRPLVTRPRWQGVMGLLVLAGVLMAGPNLRALAQESDEDPAPTESEIQGKDSQVSNDQEELEAIKKEVKEKVKQRLQNIILKKRAVVGMVDQITEGALVISTERGKKTASVSATTKFVDQREGEKNIEVEEVEIGQLVIALGYRKSEDAVLDTRRLVVIPKSTPVEKRIVLGIVESTSSKTLDLKDLSSEKEWTVDLAKDVRLLTKGGEEFEPVDIDELEKKSRVIVAGVVKDEEEGKLEARLIYVYPPEVSPTPEGKEANEETATKSGETVGEEAS